jgi:hypothetical protein
MKHYHLRWTQAAPDHPDWMACEVSDEGRVLRAIEHFAMGWADYRDAARDGVPSLWDQSFDPAVVGQDGGPRLHEITPEKFQALWAKGEG